MKPARVPTIRSSLAWLVIACLLPASLMALTLIAHDYQRERAQLVRDSMATVRALTDALDRDLAGTQAALSVLAGSEHLRSGDLRAFHEQANQVLRHQNAANIALIDATGQQQVNTLLPYGASLPRGGIPDSLMQIFETGQPSISDLFVGPVARRPLIALSVPVRRGERITHLLGTGIFPERLAGILAQQRLPPDWIGAIFDSSGTIVARTHEIERFVGKKGAPALLQRVAQVTEDALETTTIEGIEVLSVFNRSSLSNWTVAIGIPRKNQADELWRSLGWLAFSVAVLLSGGLGLAWVIGGRVARPIRGLSASAIALGFGEPVQLGALDLKEADEVGRALTKASRLLQSAEYQAHHDMLTGLANRALFGEIVNQQLAVCRRSAMPLALIYIDLDGFKAVNDQHGHGTGDDLLRAVSTRLGLCVRDADFVARLGGDEFAAVLMHADAAAATTVAAKLVESLAAPYVIGALTLEISASIGVAPYPDCGDSLEQLVQSADQAMYQAKSEGRRRYVVASRSTGA